MTVAVGCQHQANGDEAGQSGARETRGVARLLKRPKITQQLVQRLVDVSSGIRCLAS